MNHLISNPVETSAALSLSHDWHGRLRARQCSIVRPPHLGHCLQLCVKLDTLYISKRDHSHMLFGNWEIKDQVIIYNA